MVVGGDDVDIYASDAEYGLVLEARGVEARTVGVVTVVFVFGEDV